MQLAWRADSYNTLHVPLHRYTLFTLHRYTLFTLHRYTLLYYKPLHTPQVHPLHTTQVHSLHTKQVHPLHTPQVHPLHTTNLFTLHRYTLFTLHRYTIFTLHTHVRRAHTRAGAHTRNTHTRAHTRARAHTRTRTRTAHTRTRTLAYAIRTCMPAMRTPPLTGLGDAQAALRAALGCTQHAHRRRHPSVSCWRARPPAGGRLATAGARARRRGSVDFTLTLASCASIALRPSCVYPCL